MEREIEKGDRERRRQSEGERERERERERENYTVGTTQWRVQYRNYKGV